jgi:hypothetical protein
MLARQPGTLEAIGRSSIVDMRDREPPKVEKFSLLDGRAGVKPLRRLSTGRR